MPDPKHEKPALRRFFHGDGNPLRNRSSGNASVPNRSLTSILINISILRIEQNNQDEPCLCTSASVKVLPILRSATRSMRAAAATAKFVARSASPANVANAPAWPNKWYVKPSPKFRVAKQHWPTLPGSSPPESRPRPRHEKPDPVIRFFYAHHSTDQHPEAVTSQRTNLPG